MTSLIFYWNKSDDLYIMDSDSLDLMGDQDPILEITLDVMNAGFDGVAVDTAKLASGKYFYGVNIRPDKPEGKIISDIQDLFNSGHHIPSSRVVINRIKKAYKKKRLTCPSP